MTTLQLIIGLRVSLYLYHICLWGIHVSCVLRLPYSTIILDLPFIFDLSCEYPSMALWYLKFFKSNFRQIFTERLLYLIIFFISLWHLFNQCSSIINCYNRMNLDFEYSSSQQVNVMICSMLWKINHILKKSPKVFHFKIIFKLIFT